MRAKKHDIIAAGRSEAARMRDTVADAAPDARVAMNAGQFSTLADLIENLCEMAQDSFDGDLGDPRYWVPLAEYARLKRKQQDLAARIAEPEISPGNLLNVMDLRNDQDAAGA